jgi:hypothetical protein
MIKRGIVAGPVFQRAGLSYINEPDSLPRASNEENSMPLISCVDFEWVLSSRGHKVVVNKELSRQLVLPNTGPLRVTRPLQQHPGLFKQFAKLEQTALGVVSFANRFGLLESDPHQNDLPLWFTSAKDFAAIADATISSWSELRMSSLIRINES